MSPRTFPVIMVVLDIIAASMYAYDKNWRMAVYWVAAATLTLMVVLGDSK